MIYSQTTLLLKWLRILFSLKMQGTFMWKLMRKESLWVTSTFLADILVLDASHRIVAHFFFF